MRPLLKITLLALACALGVVPVAIAVLAGLPMRLIISPLARNGGRLTVVALALPIVAVYSVSVVALVLVQPCILVHALARRL